MLNVDASSDQVNSGRISAEVIAKKLDGYKRGKNGWHYCRCPAHDDRVASLALRDGEDGGLAAKCHAGCGYRAVIDKIEERGLYVRPNRKDDRVCSAEISYQYIDPVTGAQPYKKIRKEFTDGTKDCWFEPRGRGGSEPLLYGGERLADLGPGRHVLFFEGENKVDRARELGFYAVSCDDGFRSKLLPAHVRLLEGLIPVLCPDSDWQGEEYIADKAQAIRALYPDADIRELRLFPVDGKKGRDICDWKGDADELEELVEHAKKYEPLDIPNGETKPSKPPKFTLIPFKDIVFDANMAWRVKKLLPTVGVATFFGASKAFKSFAVIDLELCIALGWPWAGRRVMQAPAIYIAAEGAAGIGKRIEGWKLHHKEALAEVEGDIPFHVVMAAPNLGTNEKDRDELIRSIEETGVKPGVVAIDTTAQCMGGGDENNTGMLTLLANATALANHFQCLVILLHHVGHTATDRPRGHSSQEPALDVMILFERVEEQLATRLVVKKMKDEESNVVLTMYLKLVEIGKDTDGDPVTTLVVETISTREDEAMDTLERAYKVLAAIKANPNASRAELSRKCGIKESAVRYAQDGLVKERLIKRNKLVRGKYSLTPAGEKELKEAVEAKEAAQAELDRIMRLI